MGAWSLSSLRRRLGEDLTPDLIARTCAWLRDENRIELGRGQGEGEEEEGKEEERRREELTVTGALPEPVADGFQDAVSEDVLSEGAGSEGTGPETVLPEGASPESTLPEGAVPENGLPEGALPEGAVSGGLPEGGVSGRLSVKCLPEGGLSGRRCLPCVALPESTLPEGDVSGRRCLPCVALPEACSARGSPGVASRLPAMLSRGLQAASRQQHSGVEPIGVLRQVRGQEGEIQREMERDPTVGGLKQGGHRVLDTILDLL